MKTLAFIIAILLALPCSAQTVVPIAPGSEIVGLQVQPRPTPPAPIIVAYDLEKHIGLVAFNPTVAGQFTVAEQAIAKRNRELLNAAYDAMHPGGKFTFANGSTGPVLFPIQVAGKTFYFEGEQRTGRKLAGAIYGVGGNAQPLGDGEFGPQGQGGAITRFVRINPDPEGCVLRVRSGGFTSRGIQYYGRPKPGNVNSGEGPKTGAGIVYEGRINPAQTTGLCVSEFAIADCEVGIHFLAGHDEDGKFVEDKNHADNATFSDGIIANCLVGIRSDNQQSVWNVFEGISVSGAECIIEANAGGLWDFRSLRIGSWDATLLRLRDFSPNACRFDIHFYRDGGASGPNRLTLVEYMGRGESWKDFDIRLSGSIASEKDATQMIDLFRLNGMPSKNIWVDVTNIEHVPRMNWETNGPWRRVK